MTGKFPELIKIPKPFLLASLLIVTSLAALAYSSDVRNSLLKSRDQVVDQRSKLEMAYSDIDKKIDQLQQQKASINRYLQDCDRTIRDLDKTLAAQEAAYRGR